MASFFGVGAFGVAEDLIAAGGGGLEILDLSKITFWQCLQRRL
jgi:hypothetical protein